MTTTTTGPEDHDHSLGWVDLVRIGLAALASLTSGFGLWQFLAGLLGLRAGLLRARPWRSWGPVKLE